MFKIKIVFKLLTHQSQRKTYQALATHNYVGKVYFKLTRLIYLIVSLTSRKKAYRILQAVVPTMQPHYQDTKEGSLNLFINRFPLLHLVVR